MRDTSMLLQLSNTVGRNAATRTVCLVTALLAVGACGGSITAVGTDGNVYAEPGEATIGSAAHDLPCPREQVRIVGVFLASQSPQPRLGVPPRPDVGALYILEGCGKRVSYADTCDSTGCRSLMINRLDIGQPPPGPPAGAPR